jgi:hypothetical protein
LSSPPIPNSRRASPKMMSSPSPPWITSSPPVPKGPIVSASPTIRSLPPRPKIRSLPTAMLTVPMLSPQISSPSSGRPMIRVPVHSFETPIFAYAAMSVVPI